MKANHTKDEHFNQNIYEEEEVDADIFNTALSLNQHGYFFNH